MHFLSPCIYSIFIFSWFRVCGRYPLPVRQTRLSRRLSVCFEFSVTRFGQRSNHQIKSECWTVAELGFNFHLKQSWHMSNKGKKQKENKHTTRKGNYHCQRQRKAKVKKSNCTRNFGGRSGVKKARLTLLLLCL